MGTLMEDLQTQIQIATGKTNTFNGALHDLCDLYNVPQAPLPGRLIPVVQQLDASVQGGTAALNYLLQNPNSLLWTPAQLFGTTDQGVFFDVSNASSRWIDSSGTTPALVSGDPVGRLTDLSRNANPLTQSTSANRPTLGFEGGRAFVELDGNGDFLEFTPNSGNGMPSPWTIILAEQHVSGTSWLQGWYATNPGGGFIQVAQASNPISAFNGSLSGNSVINGVVLNAPLRTQIHSALTTAPGGRAVNQSNITSGTGTGAFRIGGYSSFERRFRLYAGIAISRVLTTEELELVTAWMAKKCGIDVGPLQAPADFGWTPPVSVSRTLAGTYTTDYNTTPFLVEGAPGVTTVYVDSATGNDANPGTAALPKASITTVTGGRVSKLLIKARGTFYIGWTANIQSAHDELCVEAWGGASCIFTSEAHPTLSPFVWTDEGGGVWSAPPPFASFNNINPYAGTDYENLTRYTLAASLAACQATPGTWFRQSSPLRHFINTGGASPATGHVIFGCQGSVNTFNVSTRAYAQRMGFYGLIFRGGDAAVSILGDSAFTKRFDFVNCTFQHANTHAALHTSGTSTIITHGCTAGPSVFDGFSYTTATGAAGGGAVPNAVEINNTGRNNGVTSGANQGSTTHFGGKVLRVNCTFRNNANQQMADVGAGSRSWNLGCTFGPRGIDTGNVGVQAGNDGTDVRIWLDGCTFNDVAFGVGAAAGGQVFYRNMPAPTISPSTTGTVTTY